MSKEELFKKYQEILLKTNGGADDYVISLCQISNLIKEFAEEKDQQITDLQKQLAEKEKEIHEEWKTGKEWKWEWQKVNQKLEKSEQDKISFAVDILEELADCSNYINSKLDFESGSYVSEKSIRDKIKYLKGNKYE